MELTLQNFSNIGSGILRDIIDMINLVGEVKSIKYADPNNVDYFKWSKELDPKLEVFDASIDYYIDETMTYSFKIFLDNYVINLCKLLNQLEKCGELQWLQ